MKINYPANDSSKSHLLHIPVPWVYVIAYLVGIVIQFVYPISISSTLILAITRILGAALLVVGVGIIVWAQLIFHREHTTTDPTQTSLKLITWGPYRFTRNPMYIGLFLAFIGIDGILTFVWSLILLLPVFYYVNWIVIPVEEKQLKKTFGKTYEEYCKRVRRWT
jgi:protein-S-isoprenylcysteine O-methyltransferase Ste14